VIGAQRSGSTYLHTLLDTHPQVTMARPARPEPKVFLSDEVLAKGAGWYVDTWFAHATDELVLGEKSTSYIEDPQAAKRAAQVLGKPEVVAILRDPVERAVSNWRFSTDNGFETRPLSQAVEENLDGSRAWDGGSTSVSPFAYLERGRYVDYLQDWVAVFGTQVHVVFLQEIQGSSAEVRRLYGTLGVDPDAGPDPAGGPVNQSSEPAPGLPDDLLGRLRAYYQDSDRALADLLQRDLPWPTEKDTR